MSTLVPSGWFEISCLLTLALKSPNRIFVECSWEWCSSFSSFFNAGMQEERGRFVSAPYNFYRRRRLTTDESNQEIQFRSQLSIFVAFWVRLFTLLSGTRSGWDMPCKARGREEPVFSFYPSATNPIRGTKKWFLTS